MRKDWQNLLLKIIYFGNILILFLPLLVLKKTIFPFVFPKVIFFRIIVEIIFFLWLGLALYNKDFRPNLRNPLVLTLSIFIFALVLSGIFGLDVYRSFFSNQERMTGVITWIHFWLWFLVLISVIKTQKRIRFLIWTSLVVCFLVGIYGLGQKLGLQFLIKQDQARLCSTLGNPIFVGAYALINFFLACFLFVEEKTKWRFLALFFALFSFLIILLSASRGVILSLIIGLILCLGLLVFQIKNRKKRIILGLVFIGSIIVLTAGIILIQGKNFAHSPVFLRRISHLMASAQDRLNAWKMGINGFLERPVLGWGWENYNLIYNKYYNPSYLKKGLDATWFDHSHNQLIDILSLSGIIGFFSYLLIFLSVFWIWRQNKNKKSINFLLSLVIAYFIQNIFVFDTPAPLIGFFFSLAVFYLVSDKNKREQVSKVPVDNRETKQINLPLPIFVLFSLIVLIFCLWNFNILPLIKSCQGYQATQISKIDLERGLAWFSKSLNSTSFTNPEIRCLLSEAVSKNINPENKDLYNSGLSFAIQEMKKNVEEHPLDARYWLYLGELYGLGASLDKENLSLAESSLRKALELSPQRQEIYYALSRISILKKDFDKALDLARKAVILQGDIGMSWWNLGIIYLLSGKEEESGKIFEKAVWGKHYYEPGYDKYIAQIYQKAGDYGKALYFCDKLFKNSPDDVQGQVFCVFLAKQGGNSKKLSSYLSKIQEKHEDLARQLKAQIQ